MMMDVKDRPWRIVGIDSRELKHTVGWYKTLEDAIFWHDKVVSKYPYCTLVETSIHQLEEH